MSKHPNKWVAEFELLVLDAGGSTRWTKDGHLAVLDRAGRYVTKVRTHGHDTGDTNGATGRSVVRQVLRRIEESKRPGEVVS